MSKGFAIQNSNGVVHRFTDDGIASISGSLAITGSITPNGDGLVDIGSETHRIGDIFCVQQTVGAVFETGLTTVGIGKYETGTVLVWGKKQVRNFN